MQEMAMQIKPDTPVAKHHQGQRIQRVVFSAALAIAAPGCFWRAGGEPRHEERYETRHAEHHDERRDKPRAERRDESRPEHREEHRD
jgi:hypothetical protein